MNREVLAVNQSKLGKCGVRVKEEDWMKPLADGGGGDSGGVVMKGYSAQVAAPIAVYDPLMVDHDSAINRRVGLLASEP